MGRFIWCALRVIPAALIMTSMMSPAPSAAQDLPSYARPAAAPATPSETIHGRIVAVNGAFRLTLADDRGFNDDIALQQGTIINPTGLTLAVGMTVSIRGYNAGDTFSATEIDTGYDYSGPAPVPAYYGPGYWYPGFAYGYGPAFSLGFASGFAFGGPAVLIAQPFFFVHHFHGQPIVVTPPGVRPVRHVLAGPPSTGRVNPPATGFTSRSTAPASRTAAPPAAPSSSTRSTTGSSHSRR
jgi:hypothetical protein